MKTGTRIKNAKRQILLLVLCIPAALVLLKLVLPVLPSSPMLRESFWAHKVNIQPVYDIVLVGDSRIYRGIDPDVMEAASEGKVMVFNFGFSSAGLDSFLLEKASQLLAPEGKKIMVIGISANSFLPESQRNEHLRSVVEWSSKDIWIKKNLYPRLNYFDPYAISDIYNSTRGEKYSEHYNLSSGFAASQKIPSDSTSALQAYKKQFNTETYSAIAEANFIRALFRLKEKGISIIALRMPVTHAMKKLEDAYVGQSFGRLRERLNESGVYWFEAGPGEYSSYDGSHLDSGSARRFSLELAKAPWND